MFSAQLLSFNLLLRCSLNYPNTGVQWPYLQSARRWRGDRTTGVPCPAEEPGKTTASFRGTTEPLSSQIHQRKRVLERVRAAAWVTLKTSLSERHPPLRPHPETRQRGRSRGPRGLDALLFRHLSTTSAHCSFQRARGSLWSGPNQDKEQSRKLKTIQGTFFCLQINIDLLSRQGKYIFLKSRWLILLSKLALIFSCQNNNIWE